MGSEARWVEPTRALPLRWGHYADRHAFGIILIVGGGIQLQGSNTWTLPFLLIGTLAFAVGWSILPARGWTRMLAVVLATAQLWILLAGPLAAWTFVVPYVCWMLVRGRPARSYLTVIFPLANGFIVPQFFTEMSGMLPALALSLAVFVAWAWIARLIAASPARTTPPPPSQAR